jgi:hypothetical protein
MAVENALVSAEKIADMEPEAKCEYLVAEATKAAGSTGISRVSAVWNCSCCSGTLAKRSMLDFHSHECIRESVLLT